MSLTGRPAPGRSSGVWSTAGLILASVFGFCVTTFAQQSGDQFVEGTLEVQVEDSVTGAKIEQFLDTGTRRLRLHFPGPAPAYSSGHRVRMRGRIRGETLELSSATGDVTVLALSTSNTFGEQKTAVILVNFQDNPAVSYSAAAAYATTFQTTSDFFRENSYGQTWLTGDVFGWFTLAMPSASNCDYNRIAQLADQAATASGVNLGQYRRKVYAFPQNDCGWWGLGSIGGNPSRAWINGTYSLKVVGHEMGHNFGDYHSHSQPCDVGGCSTVEYGDDRDIMGNPYSGHLTAFQKERLGWLNYGASPAIQTVSTSGRYWVDAMSLAGGTKALKILKSTTNGVKTWYYVESHAQSGFDGERPTGVVVHTGTDNTGDSSNQIDLAPTTSAWDSVLDAGQAFTDAAATVTIRTVSVGNAGASIDVTFGSAPPPPPSIGPRVLITLESPGPNATVGNPFVLRGWVADGRSTSGSGIASMDIWAFPVTGGAPVFVGRPYASIERADVAAQYGERYRYSGFNATFSNLVPGTYQFLFTAWSTTLNASDHANALTVTLTVGGGPITSIDTPFWGQTVSGGAVNMLLTGWAVDMNNYQYFGVDAVHVYAINTSTGAMTFLGAATTIFDSPSTPSTFYAPHIGALLGHPRYNYSAWMLRNQVALAPGVYYLAAYSHSYGQPSFNQPRIIAITVTN